MNKEIMKSVGFEKEVENVEKGICPFCKEQVKMSTFRNERSKREFKISGLCQECQNKMFGID